jgi:actin-related protein
MFKNTIPTTLNKLSSIAPPNARVKAVSIINRTEKKYLSWIGGSIVTSLSAFQSYWVGNQEWKELGRTVLERKCL